MLAQIDDAGESSIDLVESLQNGITQSVETFFDFIPRLLGFIIVLVVGMFVAKIIARVIRRVFKAINLDHYLDKAGIGGPLERAGYADSGKFVAKIIYYMIMLIVLKLAFESLGILALNEPFDKLIEWIPKLLVALILLIVGGIVANVVSDLVRGATATQAWGRFAVTASKVGIWFIFGSAALDQAAIAEDLVDTLMTTVFASIGAIIIIKFGVGGIWAARDRFWPGVYDAVSSSTTDKTPAPAPRPPQK